MSENKEEFELLKNINGFKMYVDDKDSLELKKKGVYDLDETNFIKYIIQPDWNCIDIGANIGYFTLIMARKGRSVFAFEADSYNYKLLFSNLEINNICNVAAFPNAVGDVDGDIKLYECESNRGMHRTYKSHWCQGKVTKVRSLVLDHIDNFFSTTNPIHFVKMDIEGSELGALKGMRKLLLSNKPILLIEFHPPSILEYGVDPKEEYDFLTKDLGYDITLLSSSFIPDSVNQYKISYNDLIKQTYNSPARNILAGKLK